CTILPTTGLFACNFSKVDTSLLQTQMDAQCACSSADCDAEPPLCASHNENPTQCEDCSNGRDDDGDRLADCGDPNCRHSYYCKEPSSSTTTTSTSIGDTTIPPTSSSSTITTTTDTVTTTTIVGDPPAFVVAF